MWATHFEVIVDVTSRVPKKHRSGQAKIMFGWHS
jgi:hypothetical protein